MQSHTFAQLGLAPQLLEAVRRQGYTVPTPVQAHTIPVLMTGSDLIGTAQTGTGKTAAFVLPILDRLMRTDRAPADRAPAGRSTARPAAAEPKALILAPTRELAIQIGESIQAYGAGCRIRHTVLFGGAPKPTQVTALRSRPEIVVATPGRLLDFIGERVISLAAVEVFVLDESDRMLDMGFIPDVRRIAGLTENRRQTIMFSATMPAEIETLARELLHEPERISITPEQPTVAKITQSVLQMDREDKVKLLPQIINDRDMFRVIVFTKTKHRATRVAKLLANADIPADAIHGDRSQSQRQRALESFKKGRIRALVATDIAARGIDVDDISHVINFEIPHEPESYVHRIGRTGRAGQEGDAISFCTQEEIDDFRAIERLIGAVVPLDREHQFHCELIEPRRPGSRGTGSSRGTGNLGRGAGDPGRSGAGRSGARGVSSRDSSRDTGTANNHAVSATQQPRYAAGTPAAAHQRTDSRRTGSRQR